MAIKALNLHTTKKVSHPDDTENPTIWEIGAIDSRVFGMLTDRSLVVGIDTSGNEDQEADVKLAQNQLAFEVVQFGLRGWDNFVNDNGDISFQTEKKTVGSKAYDVAQANIVATIPGNVLSWLSKQITDMNSVSLDEGKR